MSDTVEQDSVLVRIRRDIAESEKFRAEQNKLAAEQAKLSTEQTKLVAEQIKLFYEGEKLRSDRVLAPVIAIGGLVVGALGLVAGLVVAFVRH